MNLQREHNNIIATAAALLAIALPLSNSAQHGAGPSMDEVAIEHSMDLEMSDLTDVILLKKELIDAKSVDLAFRMNGSIERTIEVLPNGLFSSTLRAPSGEPVMIGTYKDDQLKIAHGTHAFFHWSGQLESIGEYRNGRKYGVWKRFDLAGSELPEKVYEYSGIEDLLIRNGQASFAGPFIKVIAENKERAQF